MANGTPILEGNPGIEDSATVRQAARPRYLRFLGIVLLIPLAFLLSAIPIVRSATFPAIAADPFLLHPDYPFSLKGANCEIVVFGDSTAVTGVDPTVVQRSTGMKTCNISQSQSILALIGTDALDTYLRNNTPPKYLVMQFAPETLAFDRQDFFWGEGLTLLLRTRSLASALPVMALHPIESYRFALWAIKAKLAAFKTTPPDFSATEETFRTHGGLLILPKPPQTTCYNDHPFLPPKRSWVQSLRDKYSVKGTTVLIEVAPIPTCAANANIIEAGVKGLADNPLSVYPISLFGDLDRHLTLAGAQVWSAEVSRQILAHHTGRN